MRPSLARYSAPVSFVHAPSLADFITIIVGSKFSVHTGVTGGSGGGDSRVSPSPLGTLHRHPEGKKSRLRPFSLAPISEPIGRAKNGLEPGTSCVRGLNKGLQSSSPGRWAASTLHTLKCASAPTRGCGTRVVAQYFCEFVALAGGQISLVFEAHELCSSTAENRVPTTQKGIRASCSRKLKVQPNTYLNLTILDGPMRFTPERHIRTRRLQDRSLRTTFQRPPDWRTPSRNRRHRLPSLC
jgi:hypothetical protein